MASMGCLGIRNSILPAAVALPDMSGRINHGVTLKRNVRGLTVTNVATPSPAIALSRETESAVNRNHVAWTSVRQESWEGELIVEGEIPLWLVCEYIIINFFIVIIIMCIYRTLKFLYQTLGLCRVVEFNRKAYFQYMSITPLAYLHMQSFKHDISAYNWSYFFDFFITFFLFYIYLFGFFFFFFFFFLSIPAVFFNRHNIYEICGDTCQQAKYGASTMIKSLIYIYSIF
jgi:hypothetical protein